MHNPIEITDAIDALEFVQESSSETLVRYSCLGVAGKRLYRKMCVKTVSDNKMVLGWE